MFPLAVGWTSLVLGVLAFLFFCFSVLSSARRSAPIGPHVKAAEADPAKLAEALAKLVDAFAKAGPTISVLIASLTFVGFSVWIAGHICPCASTAQQPVVKSISSMTTECTVQHLPEPATRNPSPSDLTSLFKTFDNDESQEPKRCLKTLLDRAGNSPPQLVFLVGRADRRELRAQSMRIYGGNFTVAYQRAVSLKAYLIDRYRNIATTQPRLETPEVFASHIVTMAAGPQHLGSNLDHDSLSQDRCVEIVAYWNAQ
jgi:hypothetical protein